MCRARADSTERGSSIPNLVLTAEIDVLGQHEERHK